MKFRKKPVVIEAEQYCEDGEPCRIDGVCSGNPCGLHAFAHIHTLEGTMKVNDGDWVITGVKGEKYPCKPDIFEATYESADKNPPSTGDGREG